MSRGPASARPRGGGGNQSGWRDILSSFTLRNACHLSATPSHPALGYLSDGPIFSPRPTRSVDVSGQNGLRFFSSAWPGVQNLTSTVMVSILKLFYPIFACVLLTKFTRVCWWVFGVSVLNPFPGLTWPYLGFLFVGEPVNTLHYLAEERSNDLLFIPLSSKY